MDISVENNIIELYNSGLSARAIDRKLKLSNSTSSKIIKIHNIEKHNNLPKYVSFNSIKCSRCGKIKDISNYSLIRGGDSRLNYCNNCRNKQKAKTVEAYIKIKYNERKRKARYKNIPFTVSYDELIIQLNLQNRKCFYSDEDLIFEYGLGQLPNACSMDKIIPKLGYVSGNVVFCANRFNVVKNNLSILDIKKYLPLFYNRIFDKFKADGNLIWLDEIA